MFCNQCNECLLRGQMLSIGECKLCGQLIPTPHVPNYEVCRECAIQNNLCQQCGKELI